MPLVATLVLGILFSPTLLTVGWHLGHQNPIEFKGANFLIPIDWYPSISNGAITISKLAPFVRPGKPVSAIITLSPSAIQPKTDAERESAYQTFVSLYWTHMSGNANWIRGPILAGDGRREARCMETNFENADRGISVACLALGGTWIASFDGPS